MSDLRLTKVRIRNVLGAVAMDLELGQITEAIGQNAGGKSSLLGAVHATLSRGNLMDLVHVGTDGHPIVGGPGEEDEGQPRLPFVSLTLEGPGAYYVVERHGDKSATVRERVGESQALRPVKETPAAFLRSLWDSVCADPVALLLQKEADLALLLLEALPLTLEPARLAAATAGVDPSILPRVPAGVHPLERIAMVSEAIYKARTGTNTGADAAKSAADQVRQATPANIPADPAAAVAAAGAEVERLAGELQRGEEAARGAHALATQQATREADAAAREIQTTLDARRVGIVSAREEAARTTMEGHRARAEKLRADADARIAADLAEVVAGNAVAARAAEAVLEDSRAQAKAAAAEVDQEEERRQEAAGGTLAGALAGLEDIRSALTAARTEQVLTQERAETAASARANVELAKTFDARRQKMLAESAVLTGALERLDALRRSLADVLPFPGLVIRDKRISIDGTPWAQINRAARITFLVALATMRAQAPRLGFLFVDNAESLDSPHYAGLKADLRAAGVQALIARVSDDPFTVRVEAREAQAVA